MTHPFLLQAQQMQPLVVSIYFNGRQVLRIEDGETVLDQMFCPQPGLITIHFDDDPTPIYVATVS